MSDQDDEPITLLSRHEITRRDALKLFAAALAAAEIGCLEKPGDEQIRPTVRRPEDTPGPRRLYATSMVIDGFATGLLAVSHSGRPIKIEGNPAHPASLGATLAAHQASVVELYDPHRLRAPRVAGDPATWLRFREELAGVVNRDAWLILPPDASPTITAILQRVRALHPRLRIVHHAPCDRAGIYGGTQLAFGTPLEPHYAFDRANAVVALDADVFASGPAAIPWARAFAQRRRAVEPGEQPPRLFVAEPMLTPTGSLADHRLPARAGDVASLVVSLADALGRRGVALPELPGDARAGARMRIGTEGARWVDLVAAALLRERGNTILVAGDRQPPVVHALVHRIAVSLGAVGRTTAFTRPALAAPLGEHSLQELAGALHAGTVGAVIALDCDPVYSAPPQLQLAELLRRVPFTAHVALHPGETSAACRWVMPLSHYLESWGDGRAFDGTASPIQPLIEPLHDTRSRLQILALLADPTGPAGTPEAIPDGRLLVREQWRTQIPDDAAWRAVLANGVMPDTAEQPVAVSPRGDGDLGGALAKLVKPAPVVPIEIDLAPAAGIGDGRFANNPWLQELPHPVAKLTWGNAAFLSAATAQDLDVEDGDVIRIQRDGISIELPACIVVGHADRCISVELGYGRSHPDAPISYHLGTNGYGLGAPIVRDAAAVATGRSGTLSRTQRNFGRHDREVGFHTDLATYRRAPDMFAEYRGPVASLLAPAPPPGDILQWAMTIDTTICTGCSSCVIACQAENNIPTVGAHGVRRGREMHWLRIDTYVEEAADGVEVVHQPMLCQHCEKAPCEYVCPVFATVHSPDGLNEMVYNRCIGTRFCSNNCPYKVRRFNFFAYDQPSDLTALQRNPDVTVRARGVMEKCTFCVQRIRAADIAARIDRRDVAPGEVQTACQQACPTSAIQFGALQHTESEMVRRRASKRLYGALHELGTQPRVMYLAKIRSPEETR